MTQSRGLMGYACAYTPLPLIYTAGFTPYRVLPVEDCPDRAGRLLHDNLCPHVKRILDRALGGALPDLEGMIFMNSCDSMRRLHDAWNAAGLDTRSILVDLPTTVTGLNVRFFRDELIRLAEFLGTPTDNAAVARGIEIFNQLSSRIKVLQDWMKGGELKGGSAFLQEVYNRASTTSPGECIEFLDGVIREGPVGAPSDGVPIFLFGNVLPEPEAFALFESCGARIIGDDVCTGSRAFAAMETGSGDDPMTELARGLLGKPPCARTFDAAHPGGLGDSIAARAGETGARGVIGYTAKFCDPYIARLPGVRAALRRKEIPFLLLEGDCTLRSMGQQRTRIEAFIEMMR